jgi:hypothetical protein
MTVFRGRESIGPSVLRRKKKKQKQKQKHVHAPVEAAMSLNSPRSEGCEAQPLKERDEVAALHSIMVSCKLDWVGGMFVFFVRRPCVQLQVASEGGGGERSGRRRA